MEALRDLANDFNVRDPRKLYRLARQRDLDVTQAMAFEALKADVGRQVQAPRPRALGKSAAEGRTTAAQELTGDDKNFVVTTDLGNEFATLDRELPAEAVHRTKRPEDRNATAVVDRGIQTLKKDLATRVARKGGQWSDHFGQIEFADATTALWSENAGAHPSGATLSTDLEIQNVRVLASQVVLDSALVESFNRVLLSGRSLVFSHPTVHTQQSSVPNGVAEHNVTVARAFTKLMGAFVTFWDNDAGSKIHLLANPGQDVAPIGAARQEDSLLESQMQLGSLQYPHNPMKGASEHFHFLSVLAGTYDDTVRNIDIGRVGYLRHSFIAGFPTERVPKMPLSGVSTRSGDLARFTFKGLDGTMTDLFIHLVAYQLVTLSGTGVSVLD